MSKSVYDVLVIGGGPAGAAAATFLQRQGYSCLILEQSQFPRYHVGESLIPHTYGTLDRLGLLPKLKASAFPEKHSVRFVSSSGTRSDPFYFSETIPGDGARTWQVERSEFDQICLDNARENGVDVRMNRRVVEVLFDGDRAVGVRTDALGSERVHYEAQVIIDASGHSALISSQLGLRQKVPGLEKCSLWSYYRGGKRLDGIDAGETTIFTRPGRAWIWYIPLPDDIISIGAVGSKEQLFGEDSDKEMVFERALASCEPLQERLVDAERSEPVRGGPWSLAYRNVPAAGDGWIMVGDAAAFLDPIYSSGLFLALASAEMAALSIARAFEADDLSAERLAAHAPVLMQGVDVIRHLIFAFYDPQFSFGLFAQRFPEQRCALIDCLVGDVVGKDMSAFLEALAEMTPAPAPLN